MKKILLFLMLSVLITTCDKAQLNASLRIGTGTALTNWFFAPSINFTAHNISFGPEIMVQGRRDEPANFGMHASFQIACIEVGAARYFRLYSTDDYDKYKNGWCNAAFIALHYKKLFAQYQYMQGNTFSVGIKTTLANLN